jgi:hypothetical protein
MVAHRPTSLRPPELLSLSKTALADMAWEFAATHTECASCDDPLEILRVLRNAAVSAKASKADLGRLASLSSRFGSTGT